MKRCLSLFAFLFLFIPSYAQQLAILDASPADGSAMVDLNTTVSFTFNQPVDPDAFDDLFEVSPADSIEVDLFAFTLSTDSLTVSFDVVHTQDTDFIWTFSGFYSDGPDQVTVAPYILHYTTASALGTAQVHGRVTIEDGSILPLGTIVYLANANPFEAAQTGENADFQAATLVTSLNGDYTVPYVRDGSYFPVAVRFVENESGFLQSDEILSLSYIGFYDPEDDSDANSINVTGTDVEDIDITLVSMEALATTAGEGVVVARMLADEIASDQALVAIETPFINTTGESILWNYRFYSPTLDTLTDVAFSPFEVEVLQVPIPDALAPSAFPDPFIDSDVAMTTALANGGQDFLNTHDISFMAAAANQLPEDFFEVPLPSSPFWAVVFFSISETFEFDFLIVFVDLSTGDLLDVIDGGSQTATLLTQLEEALDLLADQGLGSGFSLIGVSTPLVDTTGASSFWSYSFYLELIDLLAEVTYIPFEAPLVDITTSAGLQGIGTLPTTSAIDTDSAMVNALQAGGSEFLSTFEEVFISMSAGYFPDAIPDTPIYTVAFYADDSSGKKSQAASYTVMLHMETGEILATEGDGFATDTARPDDLPTEATLHPNYPNPFNPTTTIPFTLSEPAAITVHVYNTLGQRVATLYKGFAPAGPQTLQWNATQQPSGTYFIQLATPSSVIRRKMTLLR